jgi:phosphate starvation-inducible PhoH-like protein
MKKTFEVSGIDLTSLYGAGDQNILFLDKNLPVDINIRGNNIFCQGLKKDIDYFDQILQQMVDSIKKGNNLNTKDINKLIALNFTNVNSEISINNVVYYGKKGAIYPRTKGQQKLIETFQKNEIVIAAGPAGTGKTFLTVAYALSLLEKREIDKVIFCRPAVEAGENLGFLPGNLKEKIDPYLGPLYDSLNDLLPKNKIQNFLDNGIIEIIPLAYMRGRTINRAVMILDEAQNASNIQMKMFLTRLGVDSRAIVTGDISQIDLPSKKYSGLVDILEILKNIKGIGTVELKQTDIARHHLVKKIISAYSNSEKEKNK